MNRKLLPLLIVVLFCSRSMCVAHYVKLTSPSLSRPSDADVGYVAQFETTLSLMREKLVFLDGYTFNEFTVQRFGGSSENTVEVLQELKKLGAVYVQFRDFGEQTSAFSMDENTAKRYVRVIINSGRDDFRLSDFQAYLPQPKLPE